MNVTKLIEKISNSNLNNSKELMQASMYLDKQKQMLQRELAEVQKLEDQLKETINKRAVKQFGRHWEPIENDLYKVMRVLQGSVYVITGSADSRFTHRTISLDTDKITDFLKANGRLPDGIEPNPYRNERIQISLK